MWRLSSGASDRPICYHAAAMSLMPPTPIRLVPGLLRARGLKVGFEKIRTALESGAIPGRHERYQLLHPPSASAEAGCGNLNPCRSRASAEADFEN